MALWDLLWFAKELSMDTIHIYGDSKSLINRVKGNTTFSPSKLEGWLNHIHNGSQTVLCAHHCPTHIKGV